MATTTQVTTSLCVDACCEPSAVTRPLSLKRNAIWTTLGTGTYAAAQWLQITLIAHLGTSADVGRYALALAVSAPVFMFFNLQLRSVQATDAIRRYSFGEYLGLRLACSACAMVIVAGLAFTVSGSPAAAALTLVVGLFKAIESISDIYQGLLQKCERMDYVGRSLLLKSALILGAFSATYYVTHSILLGAAAMLCAQLGGALQYDVRASYVTIYGTASSWLCMVRNMTRVQWSKARLGALAGRALPLGIAMMLISLYGNLPRYVLNKYVGLAGVGVFAAISYVCTIGSLLVTAIGTSISPRLSQYAYANRREYHRLLAVLVVLAAALGFIGVAGSFLFGQHLLQILYGAEYAHYANVLTWAMIAGALSYVSSSFGFGATALGRFKAQPWIVGVATVVLLGASRNLVPACGIVGAAIATTIATASSLCGYVVLVFWKDNDSL